MPTLKDLEDSADDSRAFESVANALPPEVWEKAAADTAKEKGLVLPKDEAPPKVEADADKKEEKPVEKPKEEPAGTPVGTKPEEKKEEAAEDDLEKKLSEIDEEDPKLHENVKKGIKLSKQIARDERKIRIQYEAAKKEADDKVKALEERLKTPVMPEDAKKELDELKKWRRDVDIRQDPEFKDKFIKPLQDHEDSVMQTLKDLGLKDDTKKWMEARGGLFNMIQSRRPVNANMTEEQWVEKELLGKMPQFYKDRIKGKINHAYDLQEDMNKELQSWTEGAEARTKEREAAIRKDFEEGRDEEIKAIGEMAQRKTVPADATPEMKKEIEKHNARIDKASKLYDQYVKDGNNVKTVSKALIRAAQSQYLIDAMADRDAEIKDLKDRLKRIKSAGETSELGSPAEYKPPTPSKQDLLNEPDDKAVDRLMKTSKVMPTS